VRWQSSPVLVVVAVEDGGSTEENFSDESYSCKRSSWT
jgi:hypothetical protein